MIFQMKWALQAREMNMYKLLERKERSVPASIISSFEVSHFLIGNECVRGKSQSLYLLLRVTQMLLVLQNYRKTE